MRFLIKLAAGFVFVIALLVAAARIEDRIGLKPLPVETPVTRGADDPRYADAIAAASALIREHRDAISSPAYSAAVAVDGEIVWSEAVGWADIENEVPATPETRFRIGSTSKAVTASATARLAERGVVDLDAPISDYMADLPEHWRALTLRQLHSHTAGLPGYEENNDYPGLWDSYWSPTHYERVADGLSQVDGAALLYEPGTDFHYSSYDVNIAGAVVAEAANAPFLDLLKAEVFDPTGMERSWGDDVTRDIQGRAQFYKRRGRRVEPWRPVDLSARYPGGGLISTSSDLVRLGMAWLGGAYLDDGTVDAFWTPQTLSSGEVNEQSYALGWRSTRAFSDTHGEEIWYVHHGGVSRGAMSWLVVFPEWEMAIALNANARADTFGDFSAPSRLLAKYFRDARDALRAKGP